MNASVASMIYKFNMDNISLLEECGYQVEIACNFGRDNPMNKEEIYQFKSILKEKKIKIYETDCPRSLFAFGRMIKTYRELKYLAKHGNYDLVHTQSPIGGVLCRLAFQKARKRGVKVIYTAHGFHFFKGAPLHNWVLYYPIEKLCSSLNDILITINKEDFERAKKSFYCSEIDYIPGVGVDVDRFREQAVTKKEKRKELAIPENAFVLLSVGELSKRKNHQVIINALGQIEDENIYYIIAGKGSEYEYYQKLAKKNKLGDRLVLLGSRTDINELCSAADVFVHPSVREGLGIAPLEGMAAGLPLITSYVNGIKDYTKDDITGCCVQNPRDVEAFKKAIIKMRDDRLFRENCIKKNGEIVKKFSMDESKKAMKIIYENITN